jgi:cell division protein FtsI (penicillin-binding protein 3)
MANEPSFNPNEKGSPPDRRRNRAITDGFEPGSTLKAVLAASALSNGWKLSDQVWGEKGSFTIQNHKITEAEAKEKFEWVSLKKMIQVSSNVAAAKIALKLGPDRYMKTLRSFGLGSKTGIGFPGEISGRIPGRKEWSPLALANIGFGQGILVTPLQITRAYAAILNGGWLVKPSLIQTQNKRNASDAPVRILNSKLSHQLIEALESVTSEGGTGVKASLAGYRVAGKTGTAQMVDPAIGRYSKDKYIPSFVGFAVGVEPKIVIFASVVEPRGSYYAAETAAPLFKEVLNSVANRCSLPIQATPAKILAEHWAKDKLKISQASMAAGIDLRFQKADASPANSGQWVMPSLKGLSPREILNILRGHRFHLEMQGVGVVTTQSPDPGKTVAEGNLIRLILSEP